MHTSYYSFPSPVSGRSPTLPQIRVPKYGYYGIAGELTSLQGNLSLEPDISLNHLHDVRPKSSRADSSIMVATVQTCAFFSGIGVIAIPYALRLTGWLGLLLLFGFALLMGFTSYLTGRSRIKLDLESFSDIVEISFSTWGRCVVAAVFYSGQFFNMALCSLLLNSSLQLVSGWPPSLCELLVAAVAVCMANLCHSSTALRRLSALGTVATIMLFVMLVAAFCAVLTKSAGSADSSTPAISTSRYGIEGQVFVVPSLAKWIRSMGIFSYCFIGHEVLPSVFHSMREQQRYPAVIGLAFATMACCYTAIAVLGYAVYDNTDDRCHAPPQGNAYLLARQATTQVLGNVLCVLPASHLPTLTISALIMLMAAVKLVLTGAPLCEGVAEWVGLGLYLWKHSRYIAQLRRQAARPLPPLRVDPATQQFFSTPSIGSTVELLRAAHSTQRGSVAAEKAQARQARRFHLCHQLLGKKLASSDSRSAALRGGLGSGGGGVSDGGNGGGGKACSPRKALVCDVMAAVVRNNSRSPAARERAAAAADTTDTAAATTAVATDNQIVYPHDKQHSNDFLLTVPQQVPSTAQTEATSSSGYYTTVRLPQSDLMLEDGTRDVWREFGGHIKGSCDGRGERESLMSALSNLSISAQPSAQPLQPPHLPYCPQPSHLLLEMPPQQHKGPPPCAVGADGSTMIPFRFTLGHDAVHTEKVGTDPIFSTASTAGDGDSDDRIASFFSDEETVVENYVPSVGAVLSSSTEHPKPAALSTSPHVKTAVITPLEQLQQYQHPHELQLNSPFQPKPLSVLSSHRSLRYEVTWSDTLPIPPLRSTSCDNLVLGSPGSPNSGGGGSGALIFTAGTLCSVGRDGVSTTMPVVEPTVGAADNALNSREVVVMMRQNTSTNVGYVGVRGGEGGYLGPGLVRTQVPCPSLRSGSVDSSHSGSVGTKRYCWVDEGAEEKQLDALIPTSIRTSLKLQEGQQNCQKQPRQQPLQHQQQQQQQQDQILDPSYLDCKRTAAGAGADAAAGAGGAGTSYFAPRVEYEAFRHFSSIRKEEDEVSVDGPNMTATTTVCSGSGAGGFGVAVVETSCADTTAGTSALWLGGQQLALAEDLHTCESEDLLLDRSAATEYESTMQPLCISMDIQQGHKQEGVRRMSMVTTPKFPPRLSMGAPKPPKAVDTSPSHSYTSVPRIHRDNSNIISSSGTRVGKNACVGDGGAAAWSYTHFRCRCCCCFYCCGSGTHGACSMQTALRSLLPLGALLLSLAFTSLADLLLLCGGVFGALVSVAIPALGLYCSSKDSSGSSGGEGGQGGTLTVCDRYLLLCTAAAGGVLAIASLVVLTVFNEHHS